MEKQGSINLWAPLFLGLVQPLAASHSCASLGFLFLYLCLKSSSVTLSTSECQFVPGALAAGISRKEREQPHRKWRIFWILESGYVWFWIQTSTLASCMAWISYLNALSLSVCNCEMGITVIPDSEMVVISTDIITVVAATCCSLTN